MIVARSSSDGVAISNVPVHFRFCGWRHIFSYNQLWCITCILERRKDLETA